jgi:arsenate reductase (thioredoxin)
MAKETRDTPYNVLFLCTGNSARSIIAEAIMNRFGPPKFKAYSAGSQPKGEINPGTIRLLKNMNYKTEEFRSKSWEEFSGPDAPALDFVFTVCDNAANEVCPTWPGQPMTAHWGIPDPAAATGTDAQIAYAFDDAYRMLQNRITILAALPISGLDRLSLQKKLDAIGQMPRNPNEQGAA